MKQLFVINVTYKANIEIIEQNLEEHRAYLRSGYERGVLIASGPQNPKIGGIIIGIFNNITEAREFSNNDPFVLKKIAESSITEFNPILHCNEIKDKLL